MEHIQKALLSANLPAHLYAGHSFCIGAATTVAAAGIEDSTISKHWEDERAHHIFFISD